jgi:hypothetical protein
MLRYIVLFFTAVMLAFMPVQIRAQQIVAEAYMDTASIRLGEQRVVQLSVKAPAGANVAFPQVTDTLMTWVEVISKSGVTQTPQPNGQVLWQQALLVTSFEEGYHAIPPFGWLIELEGKIDTVFSEAFLLEVLTVEVDTTQAIKDIKEPEAVPYTLAEMLPWLLYSAGALLAAFLFWYWWKRRKKQPVAVPLPVVPKEPADHIALRALEKLQEARLWQQGEIKAYHSELTEIIRRYLEQQYQVAALEQTSHEILQVMERQKGLSGQLRQALSDILFLADLVKFAKQQPLPHENEQVLEKAFAFVKETSAQMKLHQEKVSEKTKSNNA